MQTEFYCHRCDHLPQYCECGEFRTPASPWAFTRRQAPTAEQVTRLQAVATEWAALADLAKRLKGKASTGAFGSGSVTYSVGVVRLGFTGGSIGSSGYITPPHFTILSAKSLSTVLIGFLSGPQA